MVATERRHRLICQLGMIAQDLSGIAAEQLQDNASFLELGFDSLFLTQLSSACQKSFGLRITFRQLFSDLPSIAALAAYLDEKLPQDCAIAAPAAAPAAAIRAAAPTAATSPTPVAVGVPGNPAAAVPQAAPAASLGAAAAPAHATAPTAHLALDGAPLSAGDVETLVLKQLELMNAQLRLLQGLPGENVSSLRASLPAPITAPSNTTQSASESATEAAASSTSGKVVVAPAASAAEGTAVAEATKPEVVKKETKLPAGFGPSEPSKLGLQPLPLQQQQHLENLIRNYARKTAGSKERTQRYRACLADPRTAAGFNRRWKEIVYPIWVERSQGSKLWDVDGNEYIDILNGFGPNFLGYRPEFITRALADQLQRGFEIGPQTPLVGEVAEMICQLTGMDRASFTCSGSEAVQAAMRLARTVTGRDKVVVFSRDYHGNFDQMLVREANRNGQLRTLPSAPGIPFQSVDDTYVLEYGTEQSLETIKQHAAEIAAVIVEPVQSRRPEFQPREFLHTLRQITRDSGVLLVFDEVVNGFRCHPGGAQAYFGVEADLATYGKVIGGGMAIGVVAGRSSVMDTFDGGFWQYGDDSFPEAGVTFFAGTFVRHPLSIAAAHATLKYLIDQGPTLQQRVAEKAARFAGQVNNLFKRYEVNIELPHFTSQMYLRINEHSELANLFAYHLRYRGVHLQEGFPSYMTEAHTDHDIDCLVAAFKNSLEAMIEDGIFGNASKLGQRSAPAAQAALAAPVAGYTQQAARSVSEQSEHPTTDLQREMWVASQFSPEASAASNGTNIVELTGAFNDVALRRAIAIVVDRHEALRSTISDDGSTVIVHASMPVELGSHDFSHLPSADAAAQLTALLDEDARQGFDLAKGQLTSFQLIKLSRDKHLLVFTAHMIICDGWGFKVVLEEISAAYSALVEGREPALAAPKQMREYAVWRVKEGGSSWARECEKYWLDQFRELPPVFDVPAAAPRPAVRSYEAARANLRLAADFNSELKRVARQQRSTPFALLLSAFATWLYALSGADDLVIGVPFAAQSALGFDSIVGQCVHTLPFRIRVDSTGSFADQMTRTRDLILNAQEYWNSNFGAIVQKLEVPNDPSRIPLVPIIFNLDPVLTGVHFVGCTARITSGPRLYFHYDLGFNIVDEGDTLLIECDYNTKLFGSESIRQWMADFHALLAGIVANPAEQLGRLPIVSNAQQRALPSVSAAAPAESAARAAKRRSDQYVAPRSEAEKRLARIFGEVLRVERVGRASNFFHLGGHSLAAVSLFAKIEQEFGKKLPLSTLFTSPTLEGVAAALQGGNASWSPLVAIQPKGSRPPLFLVHGAGGNVLLYRSLGEHFGSEHPLYGFQSKGLDGSSEPLRTVEEMAACYVREMKAVQPEGPYYLGGYCLGGTIAYEMAQILRAEGQQVPLLAMLDTYNYSRALKVSFHSFILQKAKFHLANISALHPGNWIPYLREKIRLGVAGELANLKTSMPGATSGEGVSRATSGAEATVQEINDYAAEHYNPIPYEGKLTLFKPRINYKFYPDPKMGWGDLALGGIDMVEVAVNPHSMLLEPYVQVLAAQLKEHVAPESQRELLVEEFADEEQLAGAAQ